MLEELLAEDVVHWLTVLAVLVGSVVGVHYYLSKRRYFQLGSKIPGPPGIPFLGNVQVFFRGVYGDYSDFWNKPGINNLFKLWMGNRLFVLISDPADVEIVLGSHTHVDKPVESKLFEPWLGDGVSIASGKTWKAHRKLIAPVFQLSIIKSFVPLFHGKSKTLADKLMEVVGKEVDSFEYMKEATLEMLLGSFGVTKQTEGSDEFASGIRKMGEIVSYRQQKFWLRSDNLFNFTGYGRLQENLLKVFHRFTKQVMKARKEEYAKHRSRLSRDAKYVADINENISVGHEPSFSEYEKDQEKPDLLDYIIESCENSEILIDSEVQNQIDSVLFEGHDFTAVASSTFLNVMADRPDIQEKCIDELTGIFAEKDRSMTFEDALEMKYLERCVMETLRMYPPVPVIAREVQEEIKLASAKVIIPAGSTVIIDVRRMHMSEDVYANPKAFDPDNFLLENSASRHYYSYIPFSAGPRSCIGRKYALLKLKVLLATIIMKYKILPGPNGRSQDGINLKIEDRYKIRLVPRNKLNSL